MEILGIDIGGSGIKGALVDTETGQLTADRLRISTPKPATPQAVARVVQRLVKHFSWTGPMGCTFPARIKRGTALTAANVDNSWINTNVSELLEAATGCPAIVLNDADAAGVAEMTFGAGRGRDDLVLLLTFGTGIGTALFIRQILVPNAELGHICLHGSDAEPYAADRARKQEKLTWKQWSGRVQEYLDRIEFLLSPDLIIIGGGVSKPKRATKYLKYLHTNAELVTAELRNEAGIIGAALYAQTMIERADGQPERW